MVGLVDRALHARHRRPRLPCRYARPTRVDYVRRSTHRACSSSPSSASPAAARRHPGGPFGRCPDRRALRRRTVLGGHAVGGRLDQLASPPSPLRPHRRPERSRRRGWAPGRCPTTVRAASARSGRRPPAAARPPVHPARPAARPARHRVRRPGSTTRRRPTVIARSTWAPGCPVQARDLAWVRLTFWGFDDAPAHRRAAGEPVRGGTTWCEVFRDLYDARFPIEEMRITTKAEQTAPPTGDGNDTAAFNCRPVRGATSYSQHAYGLGDRRQPVPEPLPQGRPGAPRARRRLPRPLLAPPRDDPAPTARWCARSPGSAGAGAAPGTR